MALRRRGWRVHFIDPAVADPDEAADAKVDGPGDEEVIVLATPVDVAIGQLRGLPHDGVVTSVCSVMRPLAEAGHPNFIAGHPMAGSQERGLGAARADLFEFKPWFLARAHPLVEALVADCGAEAHFVAPDEHDAAVALVSHIPQVLSTALAAYLHDRPETLRFAGSGLQTFLRLAGSDAAVWTPILDANADNIAPHVDAIARLANALTKDDFDKARAVWRALAAK